MVDGYSTTTRISTGQVFSVRHLALLDQLAQAMEPGGLGADGHRVPSSQPPARLDAIDRLRDITVMVQWWVLVGGVPMYRDVKHDMRRLVGVAWQPGEIRALDRDVRLWLTWCRVLTGWDSPAWSPNAKCPACGMRGTLRIRLDRRMACCVESTCRAGWDADTIGYLAEAVRLATI